MAWIFAVVLLVALAPAPRAWADPGDELWVATYGTTTSALDQADAIVVSPDASRVYVTGNSGTFAYEAATGLERWRVTSHGGSDIAVSPDGARVFVVSWSATVAYAASSGEEIWTAASDMQGDALALSPDGTAVYVTGSALTPYASKTRSPNCYADTRWETVALSADTGTQAWKRYENGPDAEDQERGVDVVAGPQGNSVFVTGTWRWSTQSYCAWGHDAYRTVAYGADTGARQWARTYDSGRADEPSALTVSPTADRVFVTGKTLRWEGKPSAFTTLAYATRSGAQLWVRQHPVDENGGAATAVAVGPNGGRLFVTGTGKSGAGTGDDYETVAYSTRRGREIWARHFDGAGGPDLARDVAVSPDGSTAFVTGASMGAGPGLDYMTIAYRADDGAVVWKSRYAGPDMVSDVIDVGGTAIAVDPNGAGMWVTGTSRGDYATVDYRPRTGTEVWATRYDGSTRARDIASAVAAAPDGGSIFVTGTSSFGFFSNDRYDTVAYDADTGSQLWEAAYAGPFAGADVPTAIAVNPDGRTVYVTGWSTGAVSSHDFATVAYDTSTGAQLWVARYDGPANGWDDARDVAVSPDGSMVFVTGRSDGGPSTLSDYATVAYDASTGEESWSMRHDWAGTPGEVADAVVVTPDSSTVVVTGGIRISDYTPDDYGTIAYDAHTGSEIWTDRYDGTPAGGYDAAAAIAASPAGDAIFVTGWDATVAYDPTSGERLWQTADNSVAIATSHDGQRVFVTGPYATVAHDAATGSIVWSVSDRGGALAVRADDSNVFIVRTLYGDYSTVAFAAPDGAQVWTKTFGDPGSRSKDYVMDVASVGDTVFITGENAANDYATIAYSAS